MRWRHLLVGTMLAATAGTASAGVIFNRHKSANNGAKDTAKPEDRPSELARILRTDPDERRRGAAAAELSKYDLKQHPQVGPALADALQKDPSATVRAEAADALGRLRPLTPQASHVLEQALAADVSPGVRGAARAALSPYQKLAARPGQTPEPGSFRPPQAQPVARSVPRQLARPAQPPLGDSSEPPLASASPTYGPSSTVMIPRVTDRAPKAPPIELSPEPVKLNLTPAAPPPAPAPAPAKPAKTDDEGPILNPPG